MHTNKYEFWISLCLSSKPEENGHASIILFKVGHVTGKIMPDIEYGCLRIV